MQCKAWVQGGGNGQLSKQQELDVCRSNPGLHPLSRSRVRSSSFIRTTLTSDLKTPPNSGLCFHPTPHFSLCPALYLLDLRGEREADSLGHLTSQSWFWSLEVSGPWTVKY
ncbi:hypothetical protein CB1_001867004 [Camelus ferus]|nr:hypothetical protein CB1_001867004 [Camelus ferus]